MNRKAIAGIILGAEVALAAYIALGVWVVLFWMIHDFEAVRMVPVDWYIEGARRFGVAIFVGAVFGGFTYFVNRRWVTKLLPNSPRLGKRIAVALAFVIVLAGLAGAIEFVIDKPYM